MIQNIKKNEPLISINIQFLSNINFDIVDTNQRDVILQNRKKRFL